MKLVRFGLSVIKSFILKVKFGKRLELQKINQDIRFTTEIKVKKEVSMRIGRVSTRTNVHIVCVEGNMEIGKQVNINRNCIIICRYKISIGDNCSLGPNICIYDHDHLFGKNGLVPNEYKCSEIIIESGCWIGAGAIILRGTHIGKNSVIGAGTIVKGYVPPNSLVTSTRNNIISEIY